MRFERGQIDWTSAIGLLEIKKREEQMNSAQYLVWVFASMVGSVKEKLHQTD